MNLPNLLHGYLGLAPGDANAMRATMDSAVAAGFTHARFIASGYWPTDMTTGNGWNANPTAFLAAFDQLVADARARGLRLIPSLLWQFYLFADINNAPVQDLFTPGTATRLMANAYITAIVSRYANDPVILAWELGNELNLLADLDVSTCNVCPGNPSPNACGTLVPSLGTPCQRSTLDNIFSCNSCRGVSTAVEDLGQFAASMATLVHGLDPGKPFSTGHAYPRAAAWHLSRSPCPNCDWTADDVTQYESALLNLHPAGVDIISAHHYAEDGRFGSADTVLVNLLNLTQDIAVRNGRQFYVGEYGEPRAGSVTCGTTESCNGDADKLITRRLVSAMEEAGVAWSALWAWEFLQFCADVPTCYTVRDDDEVVPWLTAHQTARGSCAGQADLTACPAGHCQGGQCVPKVVLAWDFETAGSEAGFLHWTNCANGAGESFGRVNGPPGRQVLELRSGDLLTSGCNFAGAYALSPVVAATGGTLLLHAVGQAPGGAVVRVQFFDATNAQLGDAPVTVAPGTTWRAFGRSFTAPAGTASVQLRLEVVAANAWVGLDELRLDWRP